MTKDPAVQDRPREVPPSSTPKRVKSTLARQLREARAAEAAARGVGPDAEPEVEELPEVGGRGRCGGRAGQGGRPTAGAGSPEVPGLGKSEGRRGARERGRTANGDALPPGSVKRLTSRGAVSPVRPARAAPRSLRDAVVPGAPGFELLGAWFAGRGWAPFEYQRRAWDAFAGGRSGLIHLPTGAGKTYAAYVGPLAALIDEIRTKLAADAGPTVEPDSAAGTPAKGRSPLGVRGLRILYLTPLRAVARDIEAALALPVKDLKLPITVEGRTGDTPASVRARQREELPNVLVTTPESLTLLLTRPNCRELLGGVNSVILDEWHELLSSKRGTQTELALARLRSLSPELRTWALSATIANVDEAARIAVGAEHARPEPPVVIRGDIPRPVEITSILPASPRDLPWAGHMGITMLPRVVGALDPARVTLVFLNTRSQAEKWYQAIRFAKPEWAPLMGLHHGSIDRAERERVEAGLKTGALRIVVATSSLDLGVDFSPVERVFQIGSAKGVARLLQRAGRSGHRPGEPCRVVCVPTHGLELVEIAAAREAAEHGVVEPRLPLSKPLDVLAQHLVTCALGGGFDGEQLFAEVRTAWSYRDLTREEFAWTLSLVREGGGTLRAYPDYHRVKLAPPDDLASVPDARAASPSAGASSEVTEVGSGLGERFERSSGFRGKYVHAQGERSRLAHLHRLNVGTITSDGTLDLCYRNGRRLGSIEEHFITNLRVGDKFFFAGKTLAFLGLHDLTAYVAPARGKASLTPIWSGTRLPISESLGAGVRAMLERIGEADAAGKDASEYGPEAECARMLVSVQARLSKVPRAGEVLAEVCRTREGLHLFVFPFEGRLVHAGLAAIVALRLARARKATFLTVGNDYGFELVTADSSYPLVELVRSGGVFSAERLLDDASDGIAHAQLARLQFRDIARVAGLVFQSHPGARKTARQMQASSSLIFDVFSEFDPGNLLLEQARREVMERQFEQTRLSRTMRRLGESPLVLIEAPCPTPLSLPLILERNAARVSTETLLDQFNRMRAVWEEEATGDRRQAKEESGKAGSRAGERKATRKGGTVQRRTGGKRRP